jgi:glycosyl-4,4'-diaponeurosporenoate acyltransferase
VTPLAAVAVDIVVWIVWGTSVGWAASRVPASRLSTDTALTRLRSWETGGRVYERLAIRRWKDRLPDAGSLFGGRRKHLPGRAPEALAAFAAETRRAELVHWVVPAGVVVFPAWNPWPITAVMMVYAVAANLPCLLVQRYNRARIARMVPC